MGYQNCNKSIPICQYCKFCCIIILFAVLLCSCEKKTHITIQAAGLFERPSTQDLHVIDEKYEAALARCNERLNHVEKDSVEAADIYNVMGGIYAEYLLEQENAFFYLNKAIEIHQREEDEIGLAQDYTAMSNIYIYIGGDAKAGLEYLEKAEQIFYGYGLEGSFDLAGVLINKGQLYLEEGQYEDALGVLIKAQNILEKRQESSITIYLLKGQVYLEKLEYVLAEEQYLKALKICQNENDNYNISRIKFELGWLYCQMEKCDKAIECYNQSLLIAQSSNVFLSNSATTYNNIAYCYDQLQEPEKALDTSTKSCQLIEKVEPVTSKTIKSQKIYKNNLSEYWLICYQKKSKDEFERWYQETVIEERDWRESDLEKMKIQAD